MPLDPLLLEILACPQCKAAVELEGGSACAEGPRASAGPGQPAVLVCVRCGLRYRVKDGIPIMLVEEAEPPAPGWRPKTDQ